MQGFNMGRYRPPEALDSALAADGRSETLQKSNPALGARGRKLHLGVTIVRFEMPFAIWCNTCPSESSSSIIGQGVRFNAEKKKVGNYFSSPIWSFRMKHAACGGWLEIRTDPKNSEYEVVDGARRRDTGEDAVVADRTGAIIVGADTKAREDAFTALEGKKEDTVRAKTEAARLEDLKVLKARDWVNPDETSKKLRRDFRAGRKVREKESAATAMLQDRMGLAIDLLPESDHDRQRAALIEFGEEVGAQGEDVDMTASLAHKPLFEPKSTLKNSKMTLSTQKLQSQLFGNTRSKEDPFSQTPQQRLRTRPKITGIKRKIDEPELGTRTGRLPTQQAADEDTRLDEPGSGDVKQAPLLVAYDDSE